MATKSGIARKLSAVCSAFSLPILVMLVLLTKAKLADVEFASKEITGNAFQRPLEDVLEHVSRHRRLWARAARGDGSLAEALATEQAAVTQALTQVAAVDRKYGEELQFTPEGLGLRQRTQFTAKNLQRKWAALNAGTALTDIRQTDGAYRDLIAHVRVMITHAGDESNLILDPDLDSYYLMDATLLALPQMEDRLQEIAVAVDNLSAVGRLGEKDKVQLATLAAFLREADWERAAASTRTAFNEDRNFHGVSPSLAPVLSPDLARCAEHTAHVLARLEGLSETGDITGFDLGAFRGELDLLDAAVHDFHADAFGEEDKLLEIRIADFRQSLRVGLLLAAAALLVSALFAFWLAADIVRRVRRIAAATDAFARGEMGARVGGAGSDELGELARSFDAMTDRIGGLTLEVQRRAQELEGINSNLEHIVDDRTRELKRRNDEFRRILDNAHDGMLTIDLHGAMSNERSAVMDRWFGAPEPGTSFADYIAADNPMLATELELGLEQIAADLLPLELCLDQMPRQMQKDGKHLRISYQPIVVQNRVSRLLVVLVDATSEVEGRRAAALQQEIVRVFQACRDDRLGFLDFFLDAHEIVERICSSEQSPLAELRRAIHTLKGNCALFGIFSVSSLCHEIETHIAEHGVVLGSDTELLGKTWGELALMVRQTLGDGASDGVEIADDEYVGIVDLIVRGAARRNILAAIAQWKLEPTARRLHRFAEDAKRMARRLGKDVEVTLEPNDVRLCADTWGPLWAALTHAVRNAVDHGLEPSAERVQHGKPARGKLCLRTSVAAGRVLIEIVDDGRGIGWEQLRAKGERIGLPHATREDLVELIFTDGVSTKSIVTDTSGRGVGMGALRAACLALGGAIELHSEPGQGTTVRCSLPEETMGGRALAELMSREMTTSLQPHAP